MVTTWKPITAGILCIVAGALNLIGGITVAALGATLTPFTHSMGVAGFMWLQLVAIPLIVLGIVSVVGGVFALQRRIWGMAFAGAICALFPPPIVVLGILAIIFLALSRQEFVYS